MSSTTTMDQIAKYWGMWGARKSSSGSSTASPIPAWAAAASSEPSWEEQAFARDAAAHLGGCVWPPRSYSCTFCQREFRSAQALGGHMNVHRRDRALLRQAGSSPEDLDVHGTPSDQPQQGALYYCRSASTDAGIPPVGSAAKGDAKNITTHPTSYLSTIIKESKKKIFSMEMREDQAIDQCDHHDDSDSEEGPARTKRRRLDHPSAAALLIFVQPMAAAATKLTACEPSQGFQLQGVDRDAKVPSPSSVSPLVDQQEVDLELRLGTTPKVT